MVERVLDDDLRELKNVIEAYVSWEQKLVSTRVASDFILRYFTLHECIGVELTRNPCDKLGRHKGEIYNSCGHSGINPVRLLAVDVRVVQVFACIAGGNFGDLGRLVFLKDGQN